MTAGTSLPDPRVSLEEARALRSFIVDLTIRVCRERTVNYFPEDFPGGGPDGMTAPGQEGKVVAVLAEELKKMGVRYTTTPRSRAATVFWRRSARGCRDTGTCWS